MLPHSLNNFEIQKYYKNEPRFNCVFSRNKKKKDEAYIVNLDKYELARYKYGLARY